MDPTVSAQSINGYINQNTPGKCLGICRSTLLELLEAYNDTFFDLDEEVFAQDTSSEDVSPVIEVILLVGDSASAQQDLLFMAFRYVRILSRKRVNLKHFDHKAYRAIKYGFEVKQDIISIECAHIMLSTLSHPPFLKLVLGDPEKCFTMMLGCLHSNNEELVCATAAAFQAFAYQKTGKTYLIGKKLYIKALSLMLEKSIDSPIFGRLLGFIHNVSSEIEVIEHLRAAGITADIIDALNHRPVTSLTIDAAGIIQNMAREEESRKLLLNSGAVDGLLELLVSCNLDAQVRAVGAIMNLLSPTCEDVGTLKQALSRVIALSALGSAL